MKIPFAALFGLSLSLLAVPSLAANEADCKAKWDAWDADKDGKLMAMEAGAAENSKAVDDAINEGFDTDGDRKLSNAEFGEACKADFKK